MKNHTVLFLGYGSIARAHAYAINTLPFYYKNIAVNPYCVAGRNESSASDFARQYGFKNACKIDDITSLDKVDTVFILGPNKVHIPHLKLTLGMKNVRRIYIEKPLFCTQEEESYVQNLLLNPPDNIRIQLGYQFLQIPPIRLALQLLKKLDFGNLIHFRAQYLRSGYLDPGYRKSRGARLCPTPEGGAIADLGSHTLSLLAALIGNQLEVTHTTQNTPFPDVHPLSDLCAHIMLKDQASGAMGLVTASRISAGAADLLEIELRFSKGAIRFSSDDPDRLHTYSESNPEQWVSRHCGNDYGPHSQFPQSGTASGWLRALVHAHYIFFNQSDSQSYRPDLAHGLAVQQLIHGAATQLQSRNTID